MVGDVPILMMSSKELSMLTQLHQKMSEPISIESIALDNIAASQPSNKSTIKPSSRFRQMSRQPSNFITLNTCWGRLELSMEKVVSFGVLVALVCVFVALAVLSSGSFFLLSKKQHLIVEDVQYGVILFNRLITKLRIAVLTVEKSTSTLFLKRHNETLAEFLSFLPKLCNDIPNAKFFNYSRGNSLQLVVKELDTFVLHQRAVVNFLLLQDTPSAKQLVNSGSYMELQRSIRFHFDILVQLGVVAAKYEDYYVSKTVMINLTLIVFSILVIAPILSAIFILRIQNDSKLKKDLETWHGYQVLDTIYDYKSQVLFGEKCKQHNKYHMFVFLQRVCQYSELCDKCYVIESHLLETQGLDGDEQILSGQPGHKPLETEIEQYNNQKYGLAFEILTDFYDNNSMRFSKQSIRALKYAIDTNSSNLPSDLFSTDELTVAMHLIPIHKQLRGVKEAKGQKHNRVLPRF